MKRIAWVSFGLGMWLLVFAPFVLPIAPIFRTPTANHAIAGVLLIALSWWILAAFAPPPIAGWATAACGLWLIVSPFVLRYQSFTLATAHDVVAGAVTLVVGGVAAAAATRTRTAA